MQYIRKYKYFQVNILMVIVNTICLFSVIFIIYSATGKFKKICFKIIALTIYINSFLPSTLDPCCKPVYGKKQLNLEACPTKFNEAYSHTGVKRTAT